MEHARLSRFSNAILQAALLAIVGAAPAAAQTAPAVLLQYDDAGSYTLVERSDWRRYDNGKYTGQVYREVRGNLSSSASGEYRGSFYIMEETLRDLRASARALDEVKPAAFRIGEDGSFVPVVDNGFPTLRGFPSFPDKPVSVGDRWTARFSRAVDPRNTGSASILPLIAEFEYRGEETYKDMPVRRIFAKYATRYRGGSTGKYAPPFAEAAGTHDVDILIHSLTGRTVLIRDRLDETFKYPDGSSVRYKGFTLTFSEGSLGGRSSVVAALRGERPPAESGAESGEAPAGKTPASPEPAAPVPPGSAVSGSAESIAEAGTAAAAGSIAAARKPQLKWPRNRKPCAPPENPPQRPSPPSNWPARKARTESPWVSPWRRPTPESSSPYGTSAS
jgi:hypothetical protein